MNIDLNTIEAMTTNELEALYGELSTEEFRLKVALSVVSLELETRQKTRRETPHGVEERTTSGAYIITRPSSDEPDEVEELEVESPVHCGEECETCDEEAAERVARKPRSDIGTTREGVRALDHASCCGAEGRRMNSETLDCAACRGVVE